MADQPRTCAGTTKAGDPCRAAPLTDARFCLAHSDEETRDRTGFGGSQPGAGRPPLARPSDVARRLIEENVAVVLAPHFRALGVNVVQGVDGLALEPIAGGGAKLHGTSKDGLVRVSGHDDLGAQIAASEKLQDRIYGRPKQSQEISGPEGGPVRMEPVAPPDPDGTRLAKVAEIVARAHLGDNDGSLTPAQLVEGLQRLG
jgi:hypothetical protein